jgi:uncharacterized protein
MPSIDVFALARAGAQTDGAIELRTLPRLRASLLRDDGSLRFRAQLGTDSHGRAAMRLHLQAQLPLRCDRCGGETDFALDVERDFFFVRSESELAVLPIDDAPEEALLGSAHFDLTGLIEDEAILQLPMSPRHEKCPGDVAETAPSQTYRPFAELGRLRDGARRRHRLK